MNFVYCGIKWILMNDCGIMHEKNSWIPSMSREKSEILSTVVPKKKRKKTQNIAEMNCEFCQMIKE